MSLAPRRQSSVANSMDYVRHFYEKVSIDKAGCWEWRGMRNRAGYGLLWIRTGPYQGTVMLAHRIAYERAHGTVPDVLDHICRNRACVRFSHLRPVSMRENALAPGALSFAAINALKTHCKNGHPFDEENTYSRRGGGRHCRECGRAKTRRWAENNREHRKAKAHELYLRRKARDCAAHNAGVD